MALNKYAKLQKFLSHVLSLLVVFLLLAATAVWTGKLLGHEIGKSSSEKIEQATGVEMPSSEQISALHLDSKAVELIPRDSASWTVAPKDNSEPLGTIVSSAPYARDVEGFAGNTPLYIYIGADGTIKAIAAADNDETPSFFESAWEGISDKWNGMSIEKATTLEVDAVSGATYSSNAVIANVRATLAACSAAEKEQTVAPTIGWPRTLATIAVLLVGLLCSFFLKGKKWVRIIVLLLNIGVLGFWCGQFLSVSLLRGWISGGADPMAWFPTLCVLFLALIMPFFGRKHYYCTWVCPYGSLQELAGRLPLPKVKVSAKAARWMGYVRMGVLAVLLFLLWAGIGAEILNYEPFTAFMLTTAPMAVIILAAVFVVAGMFVPRLWCRAICPMGQLLDLSEK